jgi:hypothetical protein
MTAFNVSMLPTGDRAPTTLEELMTWCAISLQDINSQNSVVFEAGKPAVFVCQADVGIDSSGKQYRQSFLAVEIDPAKKGLSLPAWKQIKFVSNTTIPDQFTG